MIKEDVKMGETTYAINLHSSQSNGYKRTEKATENKANVGP